jgi:hypothetical protein
MVGWRVLGIMKSSRMYGSFVSPANPPYRRYFCLDPVDSIPGAPVFNRTISLVDTWAKMGNAR